MSDVDNSIEKQFHNKMLQFAHSLDALEFDFMYNTTRMKLRNGDVYIITIKKEKTKYAKDQQTPTDLATPSRPDPTS